MHEAHFHSISGLMESYTNFETKKKSNKTFKLTPQRYTVVPKYMFV